MDQYGKTTRKLTEERRVFVFFFVWSGLTLRTLRHAALLGPDVGVRGVAPRAARVVVGVPAEVLPQVLRRVPVRVKPGGGGGIAEG